MPVKVLHNTIQTAGKLVPWQSSTPMNIHHFPVQDIPRSVAFNLI